MRRTYLFVLFAVIFMLPQGLNAFTVVIDAGHGGHDPGACGSKGVEKNLNLDVSLRLEKLITDSCPDVDVYMTRRTDVFLKLQERADFVNKHNADLFICVHTNSAENKRMYGTETYVLGPNKMESNLEVAKRENSVIMLEDNYQTTYKGFDPNSVESYIMFEFLQDQYLDKSLQFASLVQQQFTSIGRTDRGVRQAGFWVLHKSACPSVLVEMGFVSNVNEEPYLMSKKGKDEIAHAIFNAFVAYKSSLDRKISISEQSAATEVKTPAKQTQEQENKQPQEQADKTQEQANNKIQEQTNNKTQEKNDVAKADGKQQESVKDNSKKAEMKSQPVYRVQIFTTSKALKAGDPTFKGLKGCKYTKDGNFYKYTYGEEKSYEKALELSKSLKPKFKDCFVVAFLDGEQILVKQARQMSK